MLLGLAFAVLVFWAAWLDRVHASRLPRRLGLEASPAATPSGPLTTLGVWVLAHRHRLPSAMRSWWIDDDGTAVGLAVVGCMPLVVLRPLLGLVVMAALLARPPLQRAGADRRRRRRIEDELPLMTELLRIAIDSGLNITMAVTAVAERIEGPLSDELHRALAEVERGKRISDALEDVSVRAGDATRPLIGGLIAAERYGSPLSSVLERLALEARADQSRRAERAAKRLTVYLLFPLAGCTLPAFALLTVAPLLAGSVGSLAFFN